MGCWAIFLLFWVGSAFFVKPTLKRSTSANKMLVAVVLVTAIPLLLMRRGDAFQLSPAPPTPLRSTAGDLFCVFGLLFALWARVTLGRNWSATVTLKKGHELIRTGPYAIVRHPIYSGVLLMLAGTMIFIGRAEGGVVVAIAAAALWIKLRAEERLMTTHFPAEYVAYRSQTKALIPFLL